MRGSSMVKRGLRWLARRSPWRDIDGPIPSAERWDTEYRAGRWAYLGQLSELSRYSVLVGYMTHFRPSGAVLDVGCGEGVLFRRLQPHGYARYVGVDIAESAIASLKAQQHER